MRSISNDELHKKLEEDALVINVLPQEYFEKKHIPGSINIPGDDVEFAAKVEEEAGGKDREVIVYCASYECNASEKAAKKLEEAGFTNISDYEGGTKEWFEKEGMSQTEPA